MGIFDGFARAGFRGDGGRRGEGAGLGLAIVASIAHAHDGRVLVQSEPRKGSTFTLDLPLVEAPDSPQPAGAPVGSAQS